MHIAVKNIARPVRVYRVRDGDAKSISTPAPPVPAAAAALAAASAGHRRRFAGGICQRRRRGALRGRGAAGDARAQHATAKAKKLTPMPCVPATAAPWVPGAPTVLIANFPALDNTSKCMCTWAGVISLVIPGQFTETIP
jgi:hypothetical protein